MTSTVRATRRGPYVPTEAELAASVVAYLRALQWDVYQEVAPRGADGPRADIVARQGPLVYVVECKQVLGFDVFAQAVAWTRHAHLVAVAVPLAQRSRARDYAKRVAALEGLGILEGRTVGEWERGDTSSLAYPVRLELAPRLHRHRRNPGTERLRAACVPERRDFAAAGSAGGGYWTPFKGTCEAIAEVLRERGPMGTKELVNRIRHHYRTDATARSCLPQWLRAGKIPGVHAGAGRTGEWHLGERSSCTRCPPA
jgi:hypothetical protein